MATHSNILAWRIPMDRGAWWATVHRVAKSQTQLKRLSTHQQPFIWGFSGGSDSKVSACSAGDPDLIPRLGRSPGEGNGNSLQYSCLENPHGQRSLEGYSPWGHKESDTTEQLMLLGAPPLFSPSSSSRSSKLALKLFCTC